MVQTLADTPSWMTGPLGRDDAWVGAVGFQMAMTLSRWAMEHAEDVNTPAVGAACDAACLIPRGKGLDAFFAVLGFDSPVFCRLLEESTDSAGAAFVWRCAERAKHVSPGGLTGLVQRLGPAIWLGAPAFDHPQDLMAADTICRWVADTGGHVELPGVLHDMDLPNQIALNSLRMVQTHERISRIVPPGGGARVARM